MSKLRAILASNETVSKTKEVAAPICPLSSNLRRPAWFEKLEVLWIRCDFSHFPGLFNQWY